MKYQKNSPYAKDSITIFNTTLRSPFEKVLVKPQKNRIILTKLIRYMKTQNEILKFFNNFEAIGFSIVRFALITQNSS